MTLGEFMNIYTVLEQILDDNAEAEGQEGDLDTYDDTIKVLDKIRKVHADIVETCVLGQRVYPSQIALLLKEMDVLNDIRPVISIYANRLGEQIEELRLTLEFINQLKA